jgi:hypothetical protein
VAKCDCIILENGNKIATFLVNRRMPQILKKITREGWLDLATTRATGGYASELDYIIWQRDKTSKIHESRAVTVHHPDAVAPRQAAWPIDVGT